MQPNEFVPTVSKRCGACGKAHYDDKFTVCRECGALLPRDMSNARSPPGCR